MLQYKSERGISKASLMVIGDSPSKRDLKAGCCFSGSGAIFFALELETAGYLFEKCFAQTCLDFYPPAGKATNVFHSKSEASKDKTIHFINGGYVSERVIQNAKRVWRTIDREKPKFILALGGVALWFLTGETSITKWRGSMLEVKRPWGVIRLLPTYHPSAIMRQKELKRVFRSDLARINIDGEGWAKPTFNFSLYPTCAEVIHTLNSLRRKASSEESPLLVASDIETRGGIISVQGLAWSKVDALVIPFTSVKRANFYTPREEFKIVKLLREVLTHPNIKIAGQNYNYDDQYLTRYYGIPAHCSYDTMHMAHLLWTKNLPLSLSFLASLFCDWYQFWKDDGKDFHKSIERESDELLYLRYNGHDCCYTWEIASKLIPSMLSDDFKKPFLFQQKMHERISTTINRGVRFSKRKQGQMAKEIQVQINQYRKWFESFPLGDFVPAKGAVWYDSPAKLKTIFYEVFGMEPIKRRGSNGMRPTCDQAALKVIGKREPLFYLLCEKLCEYSSLNQFANLYLKARVGADGRMRSFYSLAGTDTFRLSSRGDSFGNGMNLQNISKG